MYLSYPPFTRQRHLSAWDVRQVYNARSPPVLKETGQSSTFKTWNGRQDTINLCHDIISSRSPTLRFLCTMSLLRCQRTALYPDRHLDRAIWRDKIECEWIKTWNRHIVYVGGTLSIYYNCYKITNGIAHTTLIRKCRSTILWPRINT